MSDPSTSVLITGVPAPELARLRQILGRRSYELRHVADPDAALRLATSHHFTVVIAGYPLPPGCLERFVEGMRARTSRSVNSGLALVAAPDQLRDAAALVGRGVNKVLAQGTPEEVVVCILGILSNPRNPLARRHRIHLEMRAELRGGTRSWTTEDLSAGGVLVRASDPPEVGERFDFRLRSPAGEIRGEAKVMRRTDPKREAVRGFGARFCSFSGDGRSRLAEVLRQLRDRDG